MYWQHSNTTSSMIIFHGFKKIYGNVYLKTSYMQNSQVHDISSYFIFDLGIEFINILKRYGHKKRKLKITYKCCSGIHRSHDFSHLTTSFLFVQGRLGYGVLFCIIAFFPYRWPAPYILLNNVWKMSRDFPFRVLIYASRWKTWTWREKKTEKKHGRQSWQQKILAFYVHDYVKYIL